ncbi:MAG: hypothetical protein AAFQ87_19080, partial [Bacteroidota bacterium]
MQKIYLCLLLALLGSVITLRAQVPQSINYQAMAFDGNSVYANQTFDVRFTLHLNNTTVYQEEHFSTTSNAQGLFSLKIGLGVPVSNSFADIDWAGGPYSLRTELDDGTGYVLISDHSLSSVPYALYAERAALPTSVELDFNGDTLGIAANNATIGQVLKWNGAEWVPDFDVFNNYTPGTGIDIVGNSIINTGDTDASDDITTSSNAGGDVSGAFPALTVNGLQGNPVANSAPATGEALVWNGTQWTPSLTSGLTYSAGAGLALTGTTFFNTGDTNPGDDITVTTPAGGDLSGVYPNPVVQQVNGFPFANTTP